MLCQCGCNQETNKDKRFILNHHLKLLNQKGEKAPHYKGGKYVTSDGYYVVLKPDHPFADSDGYVREHRLVLEKVLGRYLQRGEDVHHKDGNRLNNDPSNLTVISPREHPKIHTKKDMSNRICLLCGSNKTRIKNGKYHEWYKYDDGFICEKCYFKRSSRNRDVRKYCK